MKKTLWAIFETVETIAIAVVAVLIVRSFVAQPFLVSGASMEPMFHDGDYLLIDELSYYFRTPERGEVVVFRYPNDQKSFYIKRIIGLPGEIVTIRDGSVSVNGGREMVLNESYILNNSTTGGTRAVLGPDEYFVLGDNRSFSFDSRSWGSLSKDKIVGVVRFRLWPVNRAMAFSVPTY